MVALMGAPLARAAVETSTKTAVATLARAGEEAIWPSVDVEPHRLLEAVRHYLSLSPSAQ